MIKKLRFDWTKQCNKKKTNIQFLVLRILAAAMENASAEPVPSTSDGNNDYGNDFYTTGRVGRRNAMPDILGSHCTTTTADLPDQLSALSTSDTPKKSASSTTTLDPNGPSTSQTPNTSASWSINNIYISTYYIQNKMEWTNMWNVNLQKKKTENRKQQLILYCKLLVFNEWTILHAVNWIYMCVCKWWWNCENLSTQFIS